MRLAAFPTAAPTLLALQPRVESLASLHRNPNCLPSLHLPLPDVLYINLPLSCPIYHIIQGRARQVADLFPNVRSQHIMVPSFLHLLITRVLGHQQSPLPKLGGNLRHRLSSLSHIQKLSG